MKKILILFKCRKFVEELEFLVIENRDNHLLNNVSNNFNFTNIILTIS